MTSRSARSLVVLLTGALLAGCSDVGQQRATVPLFVAGSDVAQPIVTAGGVSVMLERAQLAFGPLYLCAGFQAGELCDTARLEWLDSVVVDLLDPSPRQVGTLVGNTGPVRSWMYDLGISSQLTRAAPFVLDAAAELGGVSLVVSGRASDGGEAFAFAAEVAIQQGSETERGVPVIRKNTTEAFAHDVSSHEAGLWVRFDVQPWIEGVDFHSASETAWHNAVVLGKRPTFSWVPAP